MGLDTLEIGLILDRLDELSKNLREQLESPWLTSKGAAAYLRCSISKINRLSDRDLLPYRRLDANAPRSQRLFHRRDLTAYLITGRNPGAYRLSSSERSLVDQLL